MNRETQHRIRAAGIIIENEQILLIKVKDDSGEYWIPPGGGLEAQDRHTKDCVKRECLEEAGIHVRVGKLICVREFLETAANRYNAEFFYHIEYFDGQPHTNNLAGLNDEELIQAVEWVPIAKLSQIRTFPTDLFALAQTANSDNESLHLGSYVQGEYETQDQLNLPKI
ncbi:NUDIX domain-containing protein [Vibrio gangliei]|uniref:NUDIX domain-containing protein n=1 Tax=Vibrio gangliei TaxID=2077090 RepID=UPI000D01FDE7|nr:NUDIX domain-containing protein [Vibrio gangliei]